MHIIVCLDDRNGMLFNRRRLSSDRVLCGQILQIAADTKLWVSGYSAKLFREGDVMVAEDYLQRADQTDICFVENGDIAPHMDRVDTVTVFRWNRAYPSDTKFPMELLEGWTLRETREFPGSSHERITEERYVR